MRVQPIAPDDPQLGGSDAKFVPDFSCIFVRDDVSNGRESELLAHELGHIVIHSSANVCETDTIDVTAQEGGAIARANAYGPRERRELQANVFAREFLLPRDIARQLFLSDNLSANDIAGQLKLELTLVRLQLVDALLTDDANENQDNSTAKDQTPPLLINDGSQNAAAEQIGPAFLLEAGPGSGKTRTLAKRVEWLLAQGTSPDQILALTFSNKAAAELSDRIGNTDPQAAVQIWSGTFHAFGFDLLRRHYDKVSLPSDPRLIGKTEALELLEKRLPLMGLDHFHDLRSPASQLDQILDAISRAKDELVEAPQFEELAAEALAEGDDERRAYDERADEAARVYVEYERDKRDLGLVDYGDLVMLPTILLERDEEVRQQEAGRYQEILVDEYQDVNRASARMLKCFFKEGSRLWVVGDARQSIYRFRGASSVNMAIFEDDFPGATRRPLSFNYRSSEPIVAACRSFARGMLATHDKSLPYEAESQGPSTTDPPITIVTDTTADVGPAVVSEISKLSDCEVSLSQQAILSSTNARLDEVAASLVEANIPSIHLGSFFEREEVRDILSVLSLIAEPVGSALTRLGTLPGTELTPEDIRICLRTAREAEKPLIEMLCDISQFDQLSEKGKESLERLAHQFEGFSKDSSAFDLILTWLLDRSDYLRNLSLRTDVPAILSKAALLRLLEVIRDRDLVGRPLTPTGVLQRVRSILVLGEDRSFKEALVGDDIDAVRLMTIHGAKGLEFRAVHILDMNQENFPGKSKSDLKPLPPGIIDDDEQNSSHMEERECQFFVAISRAEEHLRLYRSHRVKTQTRTRSAFLDRINCAEKQVNVTPPIVLSTARTPTCQSVDYLSVQDLRDYEQCPLKIAYRRSFGIRTRRHESPYLRTQSVIYGVVDQLPEILASANIEEAFAEATNDNWALRGPVGDSLEPDYRELADRRITSLQDLISGFGFQDESDIVVDVAGGQFNVSPPLVGKSPGGPKTVRFIEAGAASKKSGDYLADRMRKSAAIQAYGDNVVVEIAHVADGKIVTRNTRSSTLVKAHETAGQVLSDMKEGRLHAKPDLRICTRCPYFFACPSTGKET